MARSREPIEPSLQDARRHEAADDTETLEGLLAFVAQQARARDATLTPAHRKAGGVVHTPVVLAQAMVREADALLTRHGLPRVGSVTLQVLDPATGPGVFLATCVAHAVAEGAPLVGLDVDPDARGPAWDAIARHARQRGWQPTFETRDALASAPPLCAESVLVLGNPPWSARGVGPPHTEALVRDFHFDEHRAPLRERRLGVLADAYVRFLRWSLDALERAPRGGALALVTSSSYLDGPVHRGVRALFTARCDEVSVIDLGGSALLARPLGTVDESVFGVRPGAAILLAARSAPRAAHTARAARAADVRCRVLAGTRDDKLAQLTRLSQTTTGLAALGERVHEPLASLRPRAPVDRAYASWPSLAQWMPFHAEGIQTNRDELVIDRDRDVLLARLEAIALGRVSLRARPHFDPDRAREALLALRDAGGIEAHVQRVAYRPFDSRWAFLHASLCHRPRPPLLAAMARSSIALVSVRKDRSALPWAHAALVTSPLDNCYLSARSSCRARAFPALRADGTPNFAPELLRALADRGIDAEAETLVGYLAAWLAAPCYAARFGEALALDHPRVPLPASAASLARLASLGRRLAVPLSEPLEPVRARRGLDLVRVGHHAFDAHTSVAQALTYLRQELDDELAPLLTDLLAVSRPAD